MLKANICHSKNREKWIGRYWIVCEIVSKFSFQKFCRYILMNANVKPTKKSTNAVILENRHFLKTFERRKAKAIFNFSAMIYTSIPSRRMHTRSSRTKYRANPQGNETLTTWRRRRRRSSRSSKKRKTNRNMVTWSIFDENNIFSTL